MKYYLAIKNIYENCFMTWDSVPNVMLSGGAINSIQIVYMISNHVKNKLRHKLEGHILK